MAVLDAAPSTPACARPTLLPAELSVAWLAAALLLGGAGMADLALWPRPGLSAVFFIEQDLAAAAAMVGFLVVARLAPVRFDIPRTTPRAALGLACLLVAAIALAGWPLVFRSHPLSTDEFMALFDAAIFRNGTATGAIPPEWRDLVPALQPHFVLTDAARSVWASAYLPVSAAVRAALGPGAGVAWAVLAVAATFGVARRLWPERPGAAVAAAVLLASGSQFLVVAMTPYAMPAHLALNMAWLWLFLRGDRRGDAAALAVGFLAAGLHQVVFHPLFAAPFVLQLWLSKRWTRATVYTVGYAVIGLFWVLYWRLVFPADSGADGPGLGAGFLLERVRLLLAEADPSAFGMMARNLFRFVVWQNPAATALALVAAVAAWRAEPTLRALTMGLALTVLVVGVLLPFQGHGWGYRYLHGFLGAVALLGAYGWSRMQATPAVAAGAAFSLLVMLPLQAWQASRFAAPYAAAAEAIRRADAEVVVVDPGGLFYATDLVRNDPFLARRPVVMDLGMLDEARLAQLCRTRRVALFDRAAGLAFGIAEDPTPVGARMQRLRAAMQAASCGKLRVGV